MTSDGNSDMRRPAADECAPFYLNYVQLVQGDDVLAVLRSQRGETLELLSGLGEEEGNHRYESGKWSVKEVLGHVVDTERVFCFRALSFARGEGQALPGFEQDDYVARGSFGERSLASLIEEYEAVRGATLAFFDHLEPAAWQRRGVANRMAVTVRALAFIIAGHEAHHLKLLKERYLSPGAA